MVFSAKPSSASVTRAPLLRERPRELLGAERAAVREAGAVPEDARAADA